MGRLHLTAHQRRPLRTHLQTVPAVRVYRRMLAILEVALGRPLAHIARSLGVSRRSLYNWRRRYMQSHDPTALRDRGGSGRPSRWTAGLQAVLTEGLAQKPDQLGYQAVEWPVPLLIEHLAATRGPRLSDSTLRRQLRRRGYVWKRPRSVLAPDPEREKKAPHSPTARPAGAAQRRALWGRDRPAPVSALAGLWGQAGPRRHRAAQRRQCATRGLWSS